MPTTNNTVQHKKNLLSPTWYNIHKLYPIDVVTIQSNPWSNNCPKGLDLFSLLAYFPSLISIS